MDLSKAQVLITGGSSGIGLGLAQRFAKAGSLVCITGRNKVALEAIRLPHFVNDIGIPEERERLAAYIKENMPGLNIIINNAGIQRRVSLAADNAPWLESQQEIDILLSAPFT